MKKITLDIDQISEELYQLLLKEIKAQHPQVTSPITEWSFTAEVED